MPSPSSLSLAELDDLIVKLEAEEKELRERKIEDIVGQLAEEISLLRDRKFLAGHFSDIADVVERLKWIRDAENARKVSHLHITKKQRVLAGRLIEQGFIDEFERNCRDFSVNAPIEFRITGTEGETSRQLGFSGKTKLTPSKVLSEGEQTAVALADFLAEIRLNQSSMGIVFDDPVTSFDHMRKEAIANKLVEEAKGRQVIVFTHDIVFVQYLANAASEVSVRFHGQTVSQPVAGEPGWVGVEPFPHEYYEGATLGVAKKCEEEGRKAVGDARGVLLKRGCACLRAAYEYYVQNNLLAGVIGRWRERFKYTVSEIFVDLDVAHRIDQKMAYLSRFIDGHSHSPQMHEDPLTPELLEREIKEFAKIKEDYSAARKAWEQTRPKKKDVFS